MVDGLLVEGTFLFAGKGKTGKSLYVLKLCIDVAIGELAFGEYRVSDGGGDVLYLALEDDIYRLQERMQLLRNGTAPPERLHLLPKDSALPFTFDEWCAFIEDWLRTHPGASLVVVDTYAKLRPPRKGVDWYAEDYANAQPFIDMCRDRRGLAVGLVHHMTKRTDTDDWMDRLQGSTGLTGAFDAVYMLDRVRGKSTGDLHVTGRGLPDTKRAWQFDYPLWTPAEVDSRYGQARQRIVVALQEAQRPLSPKELADATELNRSTVRVTLKRMLDAGQLRTFDNGNYAIPTPEKGVTPVTV